MFGQFFCAELFVLLMTVEPEYQFDGSATSAHQKRIRGEN